MCPCGGGLCSVGGSISGLRSRVVRGVTTFGAFCRLLIGIVEALVHC